MSPFQDNLAFVSYVASAVAYAVLAGYLLLDGRVARGGGRPGQLFLAAVVACAVWSAMGALAQAQGSVALATWATALDVLRYGLWFAFLLVLIRPALAQGELAPRVLVAAATVSLLAAAAMVVYGAAAEVVTEATFRLNVVIQLALALCGLTLVEQLFRKLGDDTRWNAKPVCLGLACPFLFDLYISTEALLFGGFDADAVSVRGAAHLLAVPFLWVAARRQTTWMATLQVSRTAAFHTATLVLVAAYLLFMSAAGSYVRFFGGSWGRALQISLLLAALAFLGSMVLSGSLRAWLRVFVSKHFFSYRFDYREEWLQFTAALSSKGSAQEVGLRVVRGLARMVESPAGALWTQDSAGGGFVQTVRWNLPESGTAEPADSAMTTFMRDKDWVINIAELRHSPALYGHLVLPPWLQATPNAWVVVPLLAGDELMGFVLLGSPRTTVKLDWEVRDLLKTAARQAASYLTQMQATEALLEARKFEAFNRMSAFVVHDLKNIVTQLSLMLRNAERLHDNREFQQDMLLTVESSLEKMRRLMLQLREGATPVGGGRGVELVPLVSRLALMAQSQGRTLDIKGVEKLATRGHEDRLERVLGHLVQNAFDATPDSGQVWIAVTRCSGEVKVEVGDTGAGMSEEFVKTRLFRPFSTTKHSGMGIGSYESYQYVRELGGSIGVVSQPGQGTVVTVSLPVFEVQHGGDLLGTSTR